MNYSIREWVLIVLSGILLAGIFFLLPWLFFMVEILLAPELGK